MLENVLAYLDSQRDEVVSLQRSLVALPALGPDNGGDGEHEKYEFIKGYLAGIGLSDLHELPAPDRRVSRGFRPNLAAVLPGQDASKTLWIISHLDIVPPGDPTLWPGDPFTLRVDGDAIYGRGVEDNNMAIVASLLAAKALLAQGTKPLFNLGLLMVSDEETGSKFGVDYLLREHAARFKTNDLFLVPDFGLPDSSMVEVAEKSILWLKVTVVGRQSHASDPDQGVNSLTAASAFILKLRGLHERFDARDNLFKPPRSTFEATKKEANVESINILPGKDVFYLDCRVLPEYGLDEVLSVIEAWGREICAEYGVDILFEAVQKEQAAPATDSGSEVVTRLLPAIRLVYGGEPRPMGVGGGTVAAYLRRRGYQTAVWATWTPNAHQPNERSSISKTIGDAKVVASMLLGAK